MMRSLTMSVLCAAVCVSSAAAGIVNNDGVTPEDSLAIAFQLLDSLGNPVAAQSGDSAWLFVWYPGGELAAVDSVRLVSDSRISARQLSAGTRVMAFYTYRNAVADVDGAGCNGVYKWTFLAYDSSLALASAYDGEFQLYGSANYSALSDSTVKCNPIRTLGVDASGYIGLNWAAISNQTANQTFTNTVIAEVTTVNNLTGKVALVDSSAHDLARLGNFHAADSALQYQTYARIDSVADTIEVHAPHGDNWAGIAEYGSGAVPCTIQVVRTGLGDTTALEGVFIRVYNSNETASAATGTSDANGRAVFGLDVDTFHVYAYQGGYAFAPQPETVIVGPEGVT
ncbi:MAG TPA: hypothetical protein VM118_05395, partial [Acidobacteriota bacterium]|nr:hypothetical protein [Acidobacteriota bacterium]